MPENTFSSKHACTSTAQRIRQVTFGSRDRLRAGCDDGLVIHGHEMSILDLFLAAISLAPLGLLLLFWRMFPDDRGIHPIYRDSRSNDTQKDRGIST
jgi:hypothetical protein